MYMLPLIWNQYKLLVLLVYINTIALLALITNTYIVMTVSRDHTDDGHTEYAIIKAETIREAKSQRLQAIDNGQICGDMEICSPYDCTGESFTMSRELKRINRDLFIDIHRIGYDI